MILNPTSPRRARMLGFALLAATFIVGAFSGAAFERTLGAREPGTRPDRCVSTPGPFHAAPGSLIIDRINLSADQRQHIDVILDRHRKEADALWQSQKPALRGIVDSTRAEIRTLLTPEQRTQYDQLLAERRAKHKNECKSDHPQEKPQS